MMVSLITDKLQRQVLDDSAAGGVDQLHLELDPQPESTVTGSARPKEVQSSCDAPAADSSGSSSLESRRHFLGLSCQPPPWTTSLKRVERIDGGGGGGGGGGGCCCCCPDEAEASITSRSDRCRLCAQSTTVAPTTTTRKKRQSHVMLSPDCDDCDGGGGGAGAALWRPDWQRSTSIWRPIGLRNPTIASPASAAAAAATMLAAAVAMPTSREAFWSSDLVCDGAARRRVSTSSESPSPVLRPASASSGFFESSSGGGSTQAALGAWFGSKQSPPSLNLSAFSLNSRLSLTDAMSSSSVNRVLPGSAGSMPAIGADDAGSGPLGLGGQPQRCRSQPSVLLERRGVKKRRREERRPHLNFIKMKETAYSKRHQGAHSRARNHVQFCENSNFLQVSKSDGSGDQSRLFYSLDTIASSPQELTFCQASVSPMGGASTPLYSAGDSEVGEGGAYRESLDSGCSGDFVTCFDSESPNDFESRRKQLSAGIEEEEEVFDLDLLDDLDIEEIEKD